MKDFARKFHAEHGLSPSELEPFQKCGAGRAEGGLCGALYAAIRYRPDKRDEIIREFEKVAEGTLCGEIRPKKNMTCTDRVALAAEILDRLSANP